MSTSANAAPGEGLPLELDQEFCRGGFFIPRQLRRDLIAPGVKDCTRSLVYFFASLTIGWRARFVVLSYSDIILGPIINQKRWTDELSGLTSDHAIRDALRQGRELQLIEERYTPWGTAYALHKRYWQQMLTILPRMIPKYDVLYRSVYNPEADPLTDADSSAYNSPASGDSIASSPAYKLEATKLDSQRKQGPSAYNLVAGNGEGTPPLAYKSVANRQQRQSNVAYKLEASESEIPPVVTPGRLKIVSKPAPAKRVDTDPLLTIGLQGCLQLGSGAAYKLEAMEQLPGQAPAGADAPLKDTSKIRNKDTKNTYYVAEASRESFVAPNGASADAERSSLRVKGDETQPAPDLMGDLSDSQQQLNASLDDRLHESPPAEDERITWTKNKLLTYRKDLEEEEDYVATCAPEDRPGVEYRILSLKGAIATLEQDLLDLRPAPPLTQENYQQQVFGAICKVLELDTRKVSDTPMAKVIGSAANTIMANKRRPDEVPAMWHRFRNDKDFRWMNGRGNIQSLIKLFAQNAGVL